MDCFTLCDISVYPDSYLSVNVCQFSSLFVISWSTSTFFTVCRMPPPSRCDLLYTWQNVPILIRKLCEKSFLHGPVWSWFSFYLSWLFCCCADYSMEDSGHLAYFQYTVQNKYFGFRYFCRLFCICTFFVPAILVQTICLLGESTCMHACPRCDATPTYKTNTHSSIGWLVHWIIYTIWKLQSSTDFPAFCYKINI